MTIREPFALPAGAQQSIRAEGILTGFAFGSLKVKLLWGLTLASIVRNSTYVIELTPKKRFQENEEATRYLRSIVDSANFHYALLCALSEISMHQRTTADQLEGAREFVRTLLNLAEVEQPQPALPTKRLVLHPDTRKHPENPQRSD